MWIRTQKRCALFDVTEVGINEENKKRIITVTNAGKGQALGTYCSKKRALEVLDEIQEAIRKSERKEDAPIVNLNLNHAPFIHTQLQPIK